MSGYLDDKLATAHVMRGGWLHTGDIGFVDQHGRLTVADRSKDLILRGGASIYPSEIEAVLNQHGAVQSAAVVGQADEYYGEQVVAVVVARSEVTASELDAWARERLAPYKLPRRYAFVNELPRGASGKTLKRLLRDALTSGAIAAEPLQPDGLTQ
jgi:long-chain acyl-CoA synthetase